MTGHKSWLIPDCFYPPHSAPGGEYKSHESICVLNTGSIDAHIDITLYFENRAPIKGFHAVCAAERTHHVRMDSLSGVECAGVPKGVPYAALVESDVPVVVQYSRLDATQAACTLMTTMGYPV